MNRKPIPGILRSRPAYHIYFWVVIFCVMIANHLEMTEMSFTLVGWTLLFMGLIVIHVYIHFFTFERLFARKKYGWYVLSVALIVALYLMVKNTIEVVFFNHDINIFKNIYLIATYLLITTSLKIGMASIEQRMALQRMKAQQVQTELELLKSQINPHFLFNTLNNLFGMVRKLDEKVAGTIAQLSHLMRYMIYESNVEKIELDKEILQVRRLIDLQKLRFSEEDDIAVEFEVEGDTKNVLVPPILLLPFVENAFKHGISLEEHSFIHIRLAVENTVLRFSVRNSMHRSDRNGRELEAGFGLQNIKRRLELLYPNTHSLDIRAADGAFEIALAIEL